MAEVLGITGLSDAAGRMLVVAVTGGVFSAITFGIGPGAAVAELSAHHLHHLPARGMHFPGGPSRCPGPRTLGARRNPVPERIGVLRVVRIQGKGWRDG